MSSNYPPQRSGLAVASMIAGILGWLIIPFFGPIIAIVTGHKAKREIRESGGAITGSGMATAGLVLGYVQMVLVFGSICVIVVLALLGPSIADVYSEIINGISPP